MEYSYESLMLVCGSLNQYFSFSILVLLFWSRFVLCGLVTCTRIFFFFWIRIFNPFTSALEFWRHYVYMCVYIYIYIYCSCKLRWSSDHPNINVELPLDLLITKFGNMSPVLPF